MLYEVIKRLIQRRATDGLKEKINVFFAAGSLRGSEYQELIGMLNGEDEDEDEDKEVTVDG